MDLQTMTVVSAGHVTGVDDTEIKAWEHTKV